MAQQTPFNANGPEERRREPRPEAVSPGRYSESRSANFVGGSVDPESGNVTRSSPLEVERGAMPKTQNDQSSSGSSGNGGSENGGQQQSRLGRVEAPPAPAMMAPPPAPPPQRSSDGSIFGTVLQVAAIGAFFFCYARGTKIAMADGSWKNVEDLRLNDAVELGGRVLARGEAYAQDPHFYRDQIVDGSHAVFEDGRFVRVAGSRLGRKMAAAENAIIVYPVVTEKHLLMLEDHIAADFSETDDGAEVTASQRMEAMNADTNRNSWLTLIARDHGFDRD